MGIEPTFEAWEAPVLPLNYTREMAPDHEFTTDGGRESPPDDERMVPAHEAFLLYALNQQRVNWSMIECQTGKQ